jgi:predicted nucleic acid-binding protein
VTVDLPTGGEGAYLLDANTLVALLDPQHCQHRAVQRWFVREAQPRGWATCPSVERVALAVMTHPDYPGRLELRDAALQLSRLRSSSRSGHAFWSQEVDLLSFPPLVLWDQVLAVGALADLELLELAHRRGGVLVTLGRRLVLNALRGPSRLRHWQPLEPLLAARPKPNQNPPKGLGVPDCLPRGPSPDVCALGLRRLSRLPADLGSGADFGAGGQQASLAQEPCR